MSAARDISSGSQDLVGGFDADGRGGLRRWRRHRGCCAPTPVHSSWRRPTGASMAVGPVAPWAMIDRHGTKKV